MRKEIPIPLTSLEALAARCQPKALRAGQFFFVVGIEENHEREARESECWFDHVRNQLLIGIGIRVLEILPALLHVVL